MAAFSIVIVKARTKAKTSHFPDTRASPQKVDGPRMPIQTPRAGFVPALSACSTSAQAAKPDLLGRRRARRLPESPQHASKSSDAVIGHGSRVPFYTPRSVWRGSAAGTVEQTHRPRAAAGKSGKHRAYTLAALVGFRGGRFALMQKISPPTKTK